MQCSGGIATLHGQAWQHSREMYQSERDAVGLDSNIFCTARTFFKQLESVLEPARGWICQVLLGKKLFHLVQYRPRDQQLSPLLRLCRIAAIESHHHDFNQPF
jgi:hypothetical protein